MPSTRADSNFSRFADQRPVLRFTFEGRSLEAREGDSVAAALLANGVGPFRTTPVSGAPRAPWCMMGVCFDCLIEIDGIPNRQACLVKLGEAMRVRRQHGARTP